MISKDEPQVRLEYQLLDETTKKIVSKKSKYYSQSEPFEIGRTEVESVLQHDDPFISRRSLYFYFITYEENDQSIPVMTYVEAFNKNRVIINKSLDNYVQLSGQTSKSNMLTLQRSPAHLLADGDVIYLSDAVRIRVFLPSNASDDISHMTTCQQAEQKLFKGRYHISQQIIGAGGQGSVYIAMSSKSGDEEPRQLVAKVMDLHQFPKLATEVVGKGWTKQKTMRLSPLIRAEEHEKAKLTWIDVLKTSLLKCSERLKIQRQLSHPNVAHIEHVIITSHTIYIFEELMTGGDLYSYVAAVGADGLPDHETVLIIYQLCQAVDYLHSKGIVHRDIKPENILLQQKHPMTRIVLTDFGQCHQIDNDKGLSPIDLAFQTHRMYTAVGTVGYYAPELKQFHNSLLHPSNLTNEANKDGYTPAIDMWSIGSITCLLLTGLSISQALGPFDEDVQPSPYPSSQIPPPSSQRSHKLPNNTNSDVDENEKYDFLRLGKETHKTDPIWSRFGTIPCDFISRLLVIKASRRMTASQALKHVWFTKSVTKECLYKLYEMIIPPSLVYGEQVASDRNIPEAEFYNTEHLGIIPFKDDSSLDEIFGLSIEEDESVINDNANDDDDGDYEMDIDNDRGNASLIL